MSTDLHTKYRPKTFAELVGNADIAKSVQRVLDGDKSHAFLFTGDSGVGKTTLARIIAAHVGCADTNIIEVDAATYNGIDDMRGLTDGLRYAPLGKSKKRVVIIDEVHAASKQAFQSLLKTIEEPPPGVYFVLCTTEAGKVPETIRTRCSTYELQPLSVEDLQDLLQKVADAERIKLDEKLIAMIARAADGSPRRGLTSLAKCEGCKTAEQVLKLLREPDEASETVIAICRALVGGNVKWNEMMKLTLPLVEVNSESTRIVIVRYLSKVIMNSSPDKAARLLSVMSAFIDPYPQQSGIAPLLLSLGRVVFE